MQTSLVELKRALSGEVALSSDLEQMATSLRNGQLPSNWRNLAPETRKSLANWLAHFQKRTEQYKAWVSVVMVIDVFKLSASCLCLCV